MTKSPMVAPGRYVRRPRRHGLPWTEADDTELAVCASDDDLEAFALRWGRRFASVEQRRRRPRPAGTLEHVVSLAAGGWHCISNLRMACSRCNRMKKDRPVAWLLTRLPQLGVPVRPDATAAGLPRLSDAWRRGDRALSAAAVDVAA